MQIQEYIALKDKNWFKTGGNARFYCEPETVEELQNAQKFALGKKCKIFMLGEGSNILISDKGFDGLVIKLNLKEIKIVDEIHTKKEFREVIVSAQAGAKLQDLVDFCINKELMGLEDFSGIPGTIGGAIYMNVHFFDKLISQFVVKANVLVDKGTVVTVDNEWMEFGYDISKLHIMEYYLVDAYFKLSRGNLLDKMYLLGKRDEIIRQRSMRYPNKNTCGSFFRNFLPNEVNFEINSKKIVNVAYYLDKIGVKGDLRVGNAVVSSKHANMIETSEGATSDDVINLAVKMQQLVKEKFGLVPQPECQLIGFNTNPFATS